MGPFLAFQRLPLSSDVWCKYWEFPDIFLMYLRSSARRNNGHQDVFCTLIDDMLWPNAMQICHHFATMTRLSLIELASA